MRLLSQNRSRAEMQCSNFVKQRALEFGEIRRFNKKSTFTYLSVFYLR